MMKKLAMILAVIMMLALCACTSDPATTTDPTPTPSAPPSETPSETPSTEPSAEPNAIPTEISRVVTLDGEDITDRVIELWEYVNAIYAEPQYDETAVRDDILTSQYRVEYAPLVGQLETANDYLTVTARQQLFKAQAIPTGRPLLVDWHDGIIYRLLRSGDFESPGRLVDITVLLSTEDTMLLSMKHLKEDYYESEYNTPTDENCECVNFEIKNRGGNWVVNDYEFAGRGWEGGDAVGYDGDYWHWGEVSEHHEVLTADGEDIYETVKKLWNVAQHLDREYEMVEELALRSEYADYWRLEGFEEVLEKYYTDAGAEQVIDDDEFVYQDGTYYKRGYYKTGVGVSGLQNVYVTEVTEDRIELMLRFELHFALDDMMCPTETYKEFTIAKEDGVWKIDDYEYIDY